MDLDNITPAHAELVELVNEYTRKEGDFDSGIQGLTIHVRNAPTEPLHCIYTLSLALVLQGSKELLQEYFKALLAPYLRGQPLYLDIK